MKTEQLYSKPAVDTNGTNVPKKNLLKNEETFNKG
jgi:hypothetical protein